VAVWDVDSTAGDGSKTGKAFDPDELRKSIVKRSHEPVFWDQNNQHLFWEKNANHNARVVIPLDASTDLLTQLGVGELPSGQTLLQLIIDGVAEQANLDNYYDRPAIDGALMGLRNDLGDALQTLQSSTETELDFVKNNYATSDQFSSLANLLQAGYYTNAQIDAMLAGLGGGGGGINLLNYYDKDEVEALALKPLADLTSLLATSYFNKEDLGRLLESFAKKTAYENFFARGITGNEFFVYDVPATGYVGAEGLGWQIGINNKPGPAKGRLGVVQVEFSVDTPTHYPQVPTGVLNQYDVFALLSDIASQQDLLDGKPSRLVDTALLKGAITQLAQFLENKFTTVDTGAGFPKVGWVYTLTAVNGANGATETTYAWREPLTGIVGPDGVDLSAYAKLVDRGQRIEADALSGENVVLRFRGAVDATTDLALQAAYSNQLDRVWVRGRTQWESRFLATHDDLFETLEVVQNWFGEAGLPVPLIPSRRIAGVVLDVALETEDEAAAAALRMARLSLLAPELAGTAARGQIEARIADKMAPPTADEVAELIDAARPAPLQSPLVTRQELDEALAGVAGYSGNTVEVPALALARSNTDPVPLPGQVWTSLVLPDLVHAQGLWSVDGPVITVPQTGEYIVDLRGFLFPAEASSDVLLRVVGQAGLYSADSLLATPSGSVLNLSAVFAAEAGDQLQLQVYPEGAALRVRGGCLALSFRRLGDAPARRLLPAGGVWADPAPFTPTADPRQFTITVPANTFTATTALQTAVTLTASGGAMASLAPGSGIVKLGGSLGRLFEVSGRLDRATVARLETAGNAIGNNASLGVNASLPAALSSISYLQRPMAILAKATPTRSDFVEPQAGTWANPRAIYVSTGSAELRLLAAGTNGAGGAIVLRDITPGGGDYIGADIVFEGKPMLLPAAVGDLLVPAGAEAGRRLSRCDIPDLQGISSALNAGHQYSLNPLPNGIYRFSGEYTVVGAHSNAGWKLGWGANNRYKDQWIPTIRRKNADGSMTYRFSWLYRMGSADGTVVGLYFQVDPGAGNGGKEMVITGKTTLRRVMTAGAIELAMPFAEMQAIGASLTRLNYQIHGQQWDYSLPGAETPLMMVSSGSLSGLDAPNAYNSNWVSTWGATTQTDKISVAPLFGNVPIGSAAGQVRWKATLSVVTKDPLAAAQLTQRVVAGSSNPSASAMRSVAVQSGSGFGYEVDFDVREPDGDMFSNFLVADLRSITTNNVLLSGAIKLAGTVNPSPLP